MGAPVPMQLWQLDVTASAFLAGGTEVKIVTGLDDHSRYCVIARAVMRATAWPVCQAFVEAMAVCGVPEEVVATQKIQVGLIHAGKIVTITAEDHSFRLAVDGQTVRVVPRTSTSEIHRYKAYAARPRTGRR